MILSRCFFVNSVSQSVELLKLVFIIIVNLFAKEKEKNSENLEIWKFYLLISAT